METYSYARVTWAFYPNNIRRTYENIRVFLFINIFFIIRRHIYIYIYVHTQDTGRPRVIQIIHRRRRRRHSHSLVRYTCTAVVVVYPPVYRYYLGMYPVHIQGIHHPPPHHCMRWSCAAVKQYYSETITLGHRYNYTLCLPEWVGTRVFVFFCFSVLSNMCIEKHNERKKKKKVIVLPTNAHIIPCSRSVFIVFFFLYTSINNVHTRCIENIFKRFFFYIFKQKKKTSKSPP